MLDANNLKRLASPFWNFQNAPGENEKDGQLTSGVFAHTFFRVLSSEKEPGEDSDVRMAVCCRFLGSHAAACSARRMSRRRV